MSKNIKNIIFDYGGILTGFNRNECIKAFNDIGARCIAQYVVEKKQEDLFYDIEIGNISTEDFCNEVRRMSGCSANNNQIVSAWDILLAGIPGNKVKILTGLSKNHNIYLLSNTNEMHWLYSLKKIFPEAGIDTESIFKGIYLSYKMKMLKPSKEIFESLAEDAAIDVNETLFIDDSQANCLAAESIGLKTLCDPKGDEWTAILEKLL